MECTCLRCGKQTTTTGGWTKHQRSCREKEKIRNETNQMLYDMVQAHKAKRRKIEEARLNVGFEGPVPLLKPDIMDEQLDSCYDNTDPGYDTEQQTEKAYYHPLTGLPAKITDLDQEPKEPPTLSLPTITDYAPRQNPTTIALWFKEGASRRASASSQPSRRNRTEFETMCNALIQATTANSGPSQVLSTAAIIIPASDIPLALPHPEGVIVPALPQLGAVHPPPVPSATPANLPSSYDDDDDSSEESLADVSILNPSAKSQLTERQEPPQSQTGSGHFTPTDTARAASQQGYVMVFNGQLAQPAQPTLHTQYPTPPQFISGDPQSVPHHPPQIYTHAYGPPPPQALSSGPYLIQPPQASNLQGTPPVLSNTFIQVSGAAVALGGSGASALNMLATTSLEFPTSAAQRLKRGKQVKRTLEESDEDEQPAQKQPKRSRGTKKSKMQK